MQLLIEPDIAVSIKGREEPVLWFLPSPLETCPLFEYCLVEVIHRHRPRVVVDARWRREGTLLSQPRLQEALQFTYRPVPIRWSEKRGYPYLLMRLVRGLLRAWPADTPVRLLLIHSPEDGWWMDILAGHVRGEVGDLAWERLHEESGSEREFCVKTRCPLLKGFPFWLVEAIPSIPGMQQPHPATV